MDILRLLLFIIAPEPRAVVTGRMPTGENPFFEWRISQCGHVMSPILNLNFRVNDDPLIARC